MDIMSEYMDCWEKNQNLKIKPKNETLKPKTVIFVTKHSLDQ